MRIAMDSINNKSHINMLMAVAATGSVSGVLLVFAAFRSLGDGAAKRSVKINRMNRSGIHDIPHQIGSKVIIQYCED